MSNLLASGFTRLFKSSMFRACNLFMCGFAFYTLLSDAPYNKSPDGFLLRGAFYISLVIAVFVGSFIGTEYKDGTIRNKLSIGHTRTAIYFSNLLVCTVASLIIHIVWLVSVMIGGLCIIGNFEMSVGSIADLIITSFFTIAAFVAIFLLACMVITSKSTGSVTAIILSLLLLISGIQIYYRLGEEEYIREYKYMVFDEDETYEEMGGGDLIKNPEYLEGTKRKVFEFLNNLLPNNQIFQLSDGAHGGFLRVGGEIPDHSAWFPLYSIAIIIVTTTVGIIVFQKKDLK